MTTVRETTPPVNPDINLGEVAAYYLASLPPEQVEEGQQNVNRFISWCGRGRRPRQLTPHEVASYAGQAMQAGGAPNSGLEAVKSFLAYLKKEGYTQQNLATHLKIRRTAGKAAQQRNQPAPEVVHLTAEALDQKRRELEQLKSERPTIAEELKLARADKDFRENAPLDAARDKQARVESRIRELEAVLRSARVLEQGQGLGQQQVKLGTQVTLREMASGQVIRYQLVSPTEVGRKAPNKISYASPLGKELLDRYSGEEIEIKAPAGITRYRIEKVEP